MEPPAFTPTPATEAPPSAMSQSEAGKPAQESYFPPYQPPTAGPSTTTNHSPLAPPSTSHPAQPPAPTNGSLHLPSHGSPSRGRGVSRGGGFSRGRGSGRGIPGRASSRLSTRLSVSDGSRYGSSGSGARANVKSLKLSFKGAGSKSEAEGGSQMSFLGEYDRELDEDPKDPLAFEEQFILRVPKEIADGPSGLREAVKGKGKGLEGVEFKFLDSRRAAFTYNGRTYASKLVDLPNIIESQKTVDNRHLFKVADIAQMLVVDHPVRDESNITRDALRVDDYFWPHGITPPLRHVRKRRFRKRVSRRTIEIVEEKVEELLRLDEDANEVAYDAIDAHANPDVPDSYYINWDPNRPPNEWGNQSEMDGSEVWDDPGSAAPEDWGDGEGGYSGDEFGEDGEEAFDEELAQALREGMGGGSDDGSEQGLSADEDEDEDDDDEKSEDDDETAAKRAKIRQFTSEIKALEAAIEKKRAGFTRGNPIMEKRFNEQVKGLEDDVRMKEDARQLLVDELDEVAASKRIPEAVPALPSKKSSRRDAADDDVEMGFDGTADNTPGDNTPRPPKSTAGANDGGDADAEGEEDDDLFGDADGEDEGDTPGVGADPEVEAQGGNEEDADGEEEDDDDDEDEEEEDQDLAAMLRAELGGSSQPQTGEAMDLDPSSAVLPDENAQANAAAALEDFALLGGLDTATPAPTAGFGVEGGVGMRRLASGVEAGADDDDDSSDSDD